MITEGTGGRGRHTRQTNGTRGPLSDGGLGRISEDAVSSFGGRLALAPPLGGNLTSVLPHHQTLFRGHK